MSGDTNRQRDVFVWDRASGATVRITDGVLQVWGKPAISANGRYVAYGDGIKDDVRDVYLWDRATGTTSRVTDGNGFGEGPVISADGRYISYSSWSKVVAGDTNNLFVWDRITGTTTRVTDGNGPSRPPAISADGRYISFYSFASNLVPGDSNGTYDVFSWDRVTGAMSRLTDSDQGSDGVPGISGDGRYTGFYSPASNLVPGDTNKAIDVFVWDRITDTTNRITDGIDGSFGPLALSANGRYIGFDTWAPYTLAGRTNGETDVFVWDRANEEIARVTYGNSPSYGPAISRDGRYITYQSAASNLVSKDNNGYLDVFLWDRGK